jgi:hypothetical protein
LARGKYMTRFDWRKGQLDLSYSVFRCDLRGSVEPRVAGICYARR